MLQKATSVTTSSRSATSSPSGADTPIQFVKGVGPRLGAIFNSRGISTVKDLLYFFPRAYEDRTRLFKVSELTGGETATVGLEIQSVRKIPSRGGRTILEARCGDDTGTMSLKWFHAPRSMEAQFQPGRQLLATGAVKIFMGRAEIVHPEITWGASLGASAGAPPGATANAAASADGHPDVGRVVPIYTEIEGVSSRLLRKILWEAIQKFSHTLKEDLPPAFIQRHALPGLGEAVRNIHFPPEGMGSISDLVEFNTPAHWRLIYEEFFKFEFLVLRQRRRIERARAAPYGKQGGQEAARALARLLPFQLTGGQGQAVREILGDISLPHPMNRLVQGDVGSGKTVVAFLTVGCVLAEGGQAALMAPTEILAEQHLKNAHKLFGGKLNAALLMGKTPASERAALFARLASGEPLLLIGTHALLEDPVVFRDLAYVLIDEQHRFGVEQRRVLRNKGTRAAPGGDTVYPHSLILTATPIPRTLALTAYGDLAVTSIQELPPGRQPIQTQVIRDAKRQGQAYQRIRSELQAGRQAYFIYPLVNESEAEGFTSLKSAVAEAERLGTEVFPEFKVGLLHGQLKPEDKARVMELFQRGEIRVLVSTTVVEVGVDVPNATVMAVEHCERFGLSQLHQLRGRVGRGSHSSYCFLFTRSRTHETTTQRLEILEETGDGFKIAEADLEIRGPGEFLGTRQAGGLPFRLANLVRDRAWLIKARDDAMELMDQDPELDAAPVESLRVYFEREGSLQFDRLKTS